MLFAWGQQARCFSAIVVYTSWGFGVRHRNAFVIIRWCTFRLGSHICCARNLANPVHRIEIAHCSCEPQKVSMLTLQTGSQKAVQLTESDHIGVNTNAIWFQCGGKKRGPAPFLCSFGVIWAIQMAQIAPHRHRMWFFCANCMRFTALQICKPRLSVQMKKVAMSTSL